MRIEVYTHGIYRVLKISDKLVISQLEELRILIAGYVAQGETHIAVNFTDASYLYSGAIAALVSCYKLLSDKNGELCILEPKPEMMELLNQIGIDSLIKIYASENNLPFDPRQIEEQISCMGSKVFADQVHS
jgi:anti-anti-sigma factor